MPLAAPGLGKGRDADGEAGLLCHAGVVSAACVEKLDANLGVEAFVVRDDGVHGLAHAGVDEPVADALGADARGRLLGAARADLPEGGAEGGEAEEKTASDVPARGFGGKCRTGRWRSPLPHGRGAYAGVPGPANFRIFGSRRSRSIGLVS